MYKRQNYERSMRKNAKLFEINVKLGTKLFKINAKLNELFCKNLA